MTRRLLLLPLLAACVSMRPAGWEVDVDANVAVAHCPDCGAPVPVDGARCEECGAGYRIEPKTITCPHCAGSKLEPLPPVCVACEDTGHCAICEGAGTFEGKSCPECEGAGTCPDCSVADPAKAPVRAACPHCLGTGEIKLGSPAR